MRRTTAIAVTASIGLLLAGCGSSTSASPAASSSSAKPSSSSATSTSASASSSSSSSAASGGAEAATWAAKFCMGAAPLAGLNALNTKGDTSTAQAAIASLGALYTGFADIFTATATGVTQAGPPPSGSTSGAVNALNASATKFQGAAAAALATDPTDATAVSALEQGAKDAFTGTTSAFDLLDNDLPADVKAAIGVAPECKVLAG